MIIARQAKPDSSSATDLRRSKRQRRDCQDSKFVKLSRAKEAQGDEEVQPEQIHRPRKVEREMKEEVAAEPSAIPEDKMEITAVEPMSILLRVPPEVWQHVLSFLATSHVAHLSLASTLMFNVCRSFPRWRTICQVSKLGQPKKKYRSHMALVCSESYYICDLCDNRSTGTGSCGLAGIPLAVSRADDQGHWWRLCRPCRIECYQKYPETETVLNEIDAQDEISEYNIIRELKLKSHHLHTFESRCSDSSSTFYTPEFMMFNRREVTAHAMAVHGGWVGVEAARRRLSYDILTKYRLRSTKTPVLTQG